MCSVKNFVNPIGKEIDLLLNGFQTGLANARYIERDANGFKYLLQESNRTNSQFSDIQDRFYGSFQKQFGCYQVSEKEVPKVQLKPENFFFITKCVVERKNDTKEKNIYLWLVDEQYKLNPKAHDRDQYGIIKNDHILCVPPSTTQLAAEIFALEHVSGVRGEISMGARTEVINFAGHHALPQLVPTALHALFQGDEIQLQNVIVEKLPASSFILLTDENRPGNSEQRTFVENALSTQDFSFMIGPPGSGKTTSTVELILQLVKKNMRILVVASTNVAIDNILEKLKDYLDMSCIKRYGNDDCDKISSDAKRFIVGSNFCSTEAKALKNRLTKTLREHPDNKNAKFQQELLENCDVKNNELLYKEFLQYNAPVTVGTTFGAGILEMAQLHAKGLDEPPFDYLIIDEASKTTIQEFIVPAALCKRWIVIGDIKQLPPYVDDDHLAHNLQICYPDDYDKRKEYTAVSDVFLCANGRGSKQIVLLVEKESNLDSFYYSKYAKKYDVLFADADNEKYDEVLPYASIIVGSLESFKNKRDMLSHRITTVRLAKDKDTGRILHEEQMQEWVSMACYNREKIMKRFDENAPKEWHDEISWRLIRMFEQRENNVNADHSTLERLKKEVKSLIPEGDYENSQRALHIFEQIYLPSFMDLLLKGFGEYKSIALLRGIPQEQLEQRCTRLSYQHRCHKDIAEIASEEFYEGKAMRSEHMVGKREWDYKRFEHANYWEHIKSRCDSKNRNRKELHWIKQELEKFAKFASQHPLMENGKEKKRSVATLSFYKEQAEELKKICQKVFANNKHVEYSAGSVDAFQGHEADIVFLSYANQVPTCFIGAPNRYNVAITRARYKMIHVGNWIEMSKAQGALGRIVHKLKPYTNFNK